MGGRLTERLFLAVALRDDVAHGLAAFLTDEVMRLPGRPTPPDKWHITIRFLGATTALQRDRLLDYLDEHLAVGPFTLSFGVLGAFPKASRASVLWLGIDRGTRHLAAMGEICEAGAQSVGLEPEDRPLHPHLTLSRIRPPMNVADLIERVPRFPLSMEIDRLTLFRSHLGRSGAIYETIDSILL